MKYYLVAGEASGDLHGSNLIKELKRLNPNAEFRFWGGDLMAAQGGTLVSHYKDRAFMGLWEVITNINTIKKFLNQAKADIAGWKPDALILIDNPGFNLLIAEYAKNLHIPVHYYIAPKVWAWNTKRVLKIKKIVNHLYSILPFEPNFFKAYEMDVDYVGNPVVDAVTEFVSQKDWKASKGIQKPIVALLPGSRKQEIERLLPLMSKAAKNFPNKEFVLAAAPNFDANYLKKLMGNADIKIVFNDTYNLLANTESALVASGTATLETALFNVPQVVCYKMANLTYLIGKRVIKVPYISLVNLIANKPVVKELIQAEFNLETLTKELKYTLENPGRGQILNGYKEMQDILGGPGASKKTAQLITKRTGE